MTTVIHELPQWAIAFRGKGGTPAVYPYDQWFDGRVHLLIRGVDFRMSRYQMASVIRKQAERRKVVLSTIAHREAEGDEFICVQADPDDSPPVWTDREIEDNARLYGPMPRPVTQPGRVSY